MKFETKIKLCQQKRYFEIGYGITSYVKYLIAFFGLASMALKTTMFLGIAYGFFCYIFGRWWYRNGYIDAEIEVTNKVDPFIKEMRHINKTKKFK